MDASRSAAYDIVCSSDDRELWLRARRSGIGASEAAVLVGEHSRWNLAHLVAEKRGRFGDDEQEREFLQWGLRLEPVLVEAYRSTRYAGRPSSRAGSLLRSIEHPWALATLDAWTQHPVHGWIPLELKTTDWARDAWENGPPPDFWWQCQQQMLVTGTPCASIACLLGPHRFVWCDVDRDDAAIRRLTLRGPEVWALVLSGEDPPPPYSRATHAALWPEDDGSTVELDERFAALDDEREGLLVEKKRVAARLDAIDDELRAVMKRATRALLPDGRTSFSLKTIERAAYSVKATSYRQLRRHETKEG